MPKKTPKTCDAEGTRASFEIAALPHVRELYAVALRYTRNPHDAEDLVQETFVRAMAAWQGFLPGSNCRAWLVRILINSFINKYRRRRTQSRFADRPREETTALLFGEHRTQRAYSPESLWMDTELGDEVGAALRALPGPFVEVVRLADIEGLPYKDIARRLGVPAGTVMSRLFRARRLLEANLAAFAARDYGIARRAA